MSSMKRRLIGRLLGLAQRRQRSFSLLLILSLALGVMAGRPAGTQAVSGLTFTAVTPFAALDSNTPCAAGPRSMYVQVNVTNNSGSTLNNLTATLNGIAVNADPLNPSATLFLLDNGEVTTRYIGTLANGATFPLYYFVNYPCTIGASINYTVTVSDGVTTPQTSGTLTLATRSEISANAGGDVLSTTLGQGAVVGQIISLSVNYTFGNPSNSGADTLLQPAGNVAFNAGCFRLVSTDITASTFTAGPLTTNDDRLYFTGVAGGSSNTLTVVYYFIYLCANTSTTAQPFADLAAGGLKYTSNYAATVISFPAGSNPFLISKKISQSSVTTLPANVTYTVTITNTSPTFAGTIDRITDVLPGSFAYSGLAGGSGVTVANSSSTPAAPATGSLAFIGRPTTSCVAGACNGSYRVPANSTLTLIYTVNIPAGTADGYYTNTATATSGNSTLGSAQAVVKVGNPPTAVTMTSFTAQVRAASIRVRWQTSAEDGTAGFNLYRSADGLREHAVQLNSGLIAAHGPELAYVWDDATAAAGQTYAYWVEEIGTSGPTQEFGPASASLAPAAQWQLFVPAIVK